MKTGSPNLMDLLKKVPNQFHDFIPGMISTIKFYQIGSDVKQFLIEHPEATTDDVLHYVDDLIDYD